MPFGDREQEILSPEELDVLLPSRKPFLANKAPFERPRDEFSPHDYNHDWESWKAMDKPTRTALMRELNGKYRAWRSGQATAEDILNKVGYVSYYLAFRPLSYVQDIRDAALEYWGGGKKYDENETFDGIIICRQGRVVRPSRRSHVVEEYVLPDKATVGRLRDALTRAGWQREDDKIPNILSEVERSRQSSIYDLGIRRGPYLRLKDALPEVPVRAWRSEGEEMAKQAAVMSDGSSIFWWSSDDASSLFFARGLPPSWRKHVELVCEAGYFGKEVTDLPSAVPVKLFKMKRWPHDW